MRRVDHWPKDRGADDAGGIRPKRLFRPAPVPGNYGTPKTENRHGGRGTRQPVCWVNFTRTRIDYGVIRGIEYVRRTTTHSLAPRTRIRIPFSLVVVVVALLLLNKAFLPSSINFPLFFFYLQPSRRQSCSSSFAVCPACSSPLQCGSLSFHSAAGLPRAASNRGKALGCANHQSAHCAAHPPATLSPFTSLPVWTLRATSYLLSIRHLNDSQRPLSPQHHQIPVCLPLSSRSLSDHGRTLRCA